MEQNEQLVRENEEKTRQAGLLTKQTKQLDMEREEWHAAEERLLQQLSKVTNELSQTTQLRNEQRGY